MDEFEAFFAKVFAYGVYAIWGELVFLVSITSLPLCLAS